MKKILFFLFFLSAAAVNSQHNEEYIKEKLDTVLSELDSNDVKNYDFSFLEKIMDFLENTGLFFRILFFAIPAALIIFVIYKMHDFYMKNGDFLNNSDSLLKTSDRNTIINEHSDDFFYNKASEYRDKNNYTLALIMLHKGSVEYLYRGNKLDKKRDYTNREIIYQIENKALSDSFQDIAGKAEQIVFNSAECEKAEFEKYENIYRSCFL